MWQSKARAPTEAGSTGSGRCAYTVELVKPGDPEGTGGEGGTVGVESQSSREQREPWLWIKVLVSLSTPGLTLADTSARYRRGDGGKHVTAKRRENDLEMDQCGFYFLTVYLF